MKSNVTDIEYLSKTRQEYENTLSFAGRGLKLNTAEEARELVAAIGKTRPLKCLRLEGNTISPAAAEELAKALADHPELERFIGNDIFTGRLKDEIPLALKSICGSINVSGAHLVEVNMSDNAYGPIGLNALVSFFASASCYSLREIRMHNNGLGPEGSKKFAAALEKCYENSGKKFALRVFVCGRNRLEMEGSRAISAVLKTIGTLEEIQMPQNGIRSNGIQFLAEAVEANPNLRVINFNDNTFLKIGAEQIAKAIAQLKKLEYVNLGDSLLRSKGAVMVARSLANLPDLKEAILSFNEINSASGLEIARLLVDGVRQTLKLLDLNGNNFGVEGKQEIEQCLEPIKSSVASLSEDEGSEEEDERGDEDDVDNSEDEDEDEDEDEEDEDEDDEEDGEEYEGGDGYEDGEEHEQYDIIEKNEVAQTVNPFSKLVIGEAMNTSIEKVDKFIGEPNIQNLKNIDDASLDSLSKHSKFNTGFVLRIVAITSDFYDSTNAADSGVIINFALSLFKRLFQSEENLNLFCEQFLTEFGLLKSEDKKFRPIEVSQKLIDCLQAIAKNESFPKSINKKIVDYLNIRNSNLDTKKSNSATLKKQNDYFIKCFS